MGTSRFKPVLEFIEESLDRDVGLFELASLVGLSFTHFPHAFKAAYGVAPYRYILKRRVERAKQLLRATNDRSLQLRSTSGSRVFKIPVADTFIAQRLQQSLKAHNLLRIAVVYRDDDYGKTALAHFEETGKAAGFQVVDSEAIAPTATDATTQLTHVKASNPQAVLVWTTLPSATVVAHGYRELGLTYPLYFSEGSANPIFLAQAAGAVDGALFATEKAVVADAIPASDPQKRVLTHYATEFAKRYPKDGPPSIFGGFGYDAVYVLADGLRHAHAGGAKLRDALEHVSYVGVSGSFHTSPTDHNGLGLDAVELTQVENGKFVVRR